MQKLVFSWLSNIIAIFVAATLVPGIDYGRNFWVLALAGLVLFGLVQAAKIVGRKRKPVPPVFGARSVKLAASPNL